ncbi:CHASE2 domain-containing protein [Altererythrobacter luteolus]|uniref:CHASE2 domain-containing protein n=1 Tax=Pontixanthobacter luteolus TaxID=295089 RepID=A0A6I4UW85_9SPHN|nr:adenylate/guanylate cyclase domain-containing protein [Pontixanthobacter luteolus]MXP45803.1 CHASE2 domain-containing protein [Pontixanthobacter luteolus]
MSESGSESFIVRGWRNVREAGPRRLALTILLVVIALIIARFGWSMPIIAQAETGMYDLRAYEVAGRNAVEQDDRIIMVVYDEQTLIKARKRSPLDRGILIQTLQNLDAMGAKAIGIDILFDQPQDEDAQLIETLRAMQTPVSVAYVLQDANEGDIVYDQQQYLEEFLAQLEGSNARPASIQLSDEFGVTRLWPTADERLPPTLTRSMLASAGQQAAMMPGYEGAIRYRLGLRSGQNDEVSGGQNAVREDLFPKFPIDFFADPETAEFADELVAGKYILIGGDLVDYDRVATTMTEATGFEPPGLQVHAEMMAQMLDGAKLPKPLPATLWAFAILFVSTAVLTGLLEWGSWRIYALLGVQFLIMLGIPFVMHFRGADTYGLPAVGWLAGWIIAFTAVTSAARAAGAVQRNFAQGALGKYLPREMAKEIIDNPKLLALHGEKKSIFVLFSDLEGFTKMSHAISPEMVAKLLNRYLEMLSQVVLDHGGVIDKFVGDAVVAFWGAPIARPDDAERAARAGYAIWQAGEAFRAEVAAMDPNLPKIGKTRVGLHYGEAVVGNFGGETRIQYTALGDSMNTAARLEAANKALGSSVMASREFAQKSGLDWWRPMGRVVLRGRARPVDIMEPAPDFPEEDRKKLHQAEILSETNNTDAAAVIEEVLQNHPDDAALRNLLHRMNNLNEGRAYVLG